MHNLILVPDNLLVNGYIPPSELSSYDVLNDGSIHDRFL